MTTQSKLKRDLEVVLRALNTSDQQEHWRQRAEETKQLMDRYFAALNEAVDQELKKEGRK
jgi:hypothetical protein